MRIEDKFTKVNFEKLEGSKETRKKNADGSSGTNASSEGDNITLSDKAKDISRLTSQLKSAPDVRQERVNELKQQISDGTYNVSGKKVAEKIINLAVDDLF